MIPLNVKRSFDGQRKTKMGIFPLKHVED